jgi:diguanylate cyclase (GGDEF)-like protein
LHDDLTGLYNRRAIASRVNALVSVNTGSRYHALFLIDLDHFKIINDSQGHRIGDKILKEVSGRLGSLVTDKRNLARLGGDEFILIVENVGREREEAGKNAMIFAKKLLATIRKPLKIDESEYYLSAGAGIDVFNKDVDFETILKHADNALSDAKIKAVNQISIFYPDMQLATNKRLNIENILRNELKHDRLFVNYQPKFEAGGEVYSAEALVRMISEGREIISPADFIPVAEETGMIIELGLKVIEKVFDFTVHHRGLFERSGLKSIAINISPTQFSDDSFCERIVSLAKKYAIPKNFIILEITEEAVVSNTHRVIDTMMRMKKEGFKLSIDDFGTGYSSLRYLQKFPLDELKIDKSFVDEISVDERAQAIIKTIISMADNLGFDVVAEGVEEMIQFQLLETCGCRHFQGYLFSKPLPESDFIAKLETQVTSRSENSE